MRYGRSPGSRATGSPHGGSLIGAQEQALQENPLGRRIRRVVAGTAGGGGTDACSCAVRWEAGRRVAQSVHPASERHHQLVRRTALEIGTS